MQHTPRKQFSSSRLFPGLPVVLLAGLLLLLFAQAKTKGWHTRPPQKQVALFGYMVSLRRNGTSFNIWKLIQATQNAKQPWLFMMSTVKDSLTTDLLMIRAGSKTVEELTLSLQSLGNIQKISFAEFSKQPTTKELAKVKELFKDLDLDASSVSNERLSRYLASVLDGQYLYYLDEVHNRNPTALRTLQIKRLEEHPQYSPDWRKNTVRQPNDTSFYPDSIVVRDVVIQSIQIESPPPPPPPPPVNFGRMSDAQIKKWIQKNNTQHLKESDIQISRTAKEVIVTIKHNGTIETLRSEIKK